MACEEHLQLSSFIKSVHKNLREKMSDDKEPDEVWKEHLENEELLEKYAAAMKELATEFWVNEENSRVSWIYNQIEHYFFQGGCSHEHTRDFKFAKRKGVLLDPPESDSKIYENEKLTVLDVGSCYNPFKQFDNFNVLAIDIAPAQTDVFKCDFLKVNISDESIKTESSIQSLGRESFQVIVFCLLLGRS